jgi:hypothetical protein
MTQCGDPRDKVYSLLGIAVPYPSLQLDLHYSLSIAEVYLTSHIIIAKGSRRLDILIFFVAGSLILNAPYLLGSWIG